MEAFERLICRAQQHDDEAMMELAANFVWKMIRQCQKYGLGMDEDMQAYLMIRFIEDVYRFKINKETKKKNNF